MAGKDRSRGIKLIALLLALLASAFAFIWVLTNDIHFAWRAGNNASSSSAASTPGEPLQLRDARAAAPAKVAAPLKTVPEQEAAEPNLEAGPIAEPLHQPDYGEWLRRGGASAVFTLRDAQGAMLIEPPERVHLFRNLGQYWLIDQCEYVDGEIRCVGLSGTGLEPGEYELEIDAQRYGRLQHKFRVTRGQKLSGEIRTPYWRRIICLKFVDPDGQPVKWVHLWPRAIQPENEAYARPNYRSPPNVIQIPSPYTPSRPPEDGRVWRIGESSMVKPNGFENGPLATDEGRVYTEVYAGARTTLETEFLDSFWGTKVVTFEDTFESPEWDEKTVILPVTDQLAAHVEREGVKGYDPGRRWLLEPPTLSEYRAPDHGRLVLAITGPNTLVPRPERAQDGKLSTMIDVRDSTTMSRDGYYWVARLDHQDPIALTVTDGETFVVGPELIHMAGQAEKHVSRHYWAVSLPRPEFRFRPTLDAFLVARQMSLYIQGEELPDDPTTFSMFLLVYDRPGPLLFAEQALAQIAKSPFATTMIDVQSACLTEPYDDPHHRNWHQSWKGTGQELVAKLKAGELHATCNPPGALVFRAVGDLGEGLPWAQGSIIPYEYDRAAARLREQMPDFRADGVDLSKISRSEVHLRLLNVAREKAAKPGAAAESYAQFLPERLAELVTDPDARYWLALNRAWYAAHNQVSTDEHGYGWSEDAALDPGKVYVLYLWSQSCDDLQPDRRVVFQATEGVTDLGVITLPSYR